MRVFFGVSMQCSPFGNMQVEMCTNLSKSRRSVLTYAFVCTAAGAFGTARAITGLVFQTQGCR